MVTLAYIKSGLHTNFSDKPKFCPKNYSCYAISVRCTKARHDKLLRAF